MSAPRRTSPGFTLIELILASAIMAVLALSMYSALHTGFKARDRALSAVGPARAAEITMDLVRTDLESALPPGGVFPMSFLAQPGQDIQGSTDLEFYNIAEPADAHTGSSAAQPSQDPTTYGSVQRVELIVRKSTGGTGELVRLTTRNLLAPSELPPEEEVLCHGVSAFALRFFDGTQWHQEWDSTQFEDSLPMMVEVSLVLQSTDVTSPKPTAVSYSTSRTFFLPCRDEAVLTGGTTQ